MIVKIIRRLNLIKNIIIVTFISCIIMLKGYSQTHHISLSLEPTHINRNYTKWFNASGFKVGYSYRFKNGAFLLTELGSTSLFGRDTSNGLLIEEALKRESIKYRILQVNGYANLVRIKKSSFFINLALSLRQANEIYHEFAGSTLTEKNTSEILVNTIYEKRWDVGTSFGFSYAYRLTPFLGINIFTEANIYGEETSFITNGIKLFFKI